MFQERREGRLILDPYVETGDLPIDRSPRTSFTKVRSFDCQQVSVLWVEDVRQWKHHGGCEDRQQENDRTKRREPLWPDKAESKEKHLVTGYGDPVHQSVRFIGGDAPRGQQ